MKKLASLFLAAFFMFSIKMLAQTTASAVWDLGDSTGAAITGNLVADTLALSDSLVMKFATGSTSGPAVYINQASGVWQANELGPDFANVYAQFLVRPQAGNNFHVDSVAFWMGCSGTNGYMHGAVYWDKDTTNFAQLSLTNLTASNQLDYDSVTFGDNPGLPDVRGTNHPVHDTSFAINTDVKDGGYFAMRFYPWYNYKSNSTGKYLVLWLVRVYGTTSPATAVENVKTMPKVFSLLQNYPNPFNPSTQITFSLDKAETANLTVYNMLGQKVATLVNGNLSAGEHTVNFSADNLSSGIYIYQLSSGSRIISKKMMLLK